MGLSTGAPPQSADVGLCYQLDGGAITNFVGANFSVQHFTTDRLNYSASATIALPPGTYRVGMCVRNSGASLINNNNYVSGWFQVTS
jgi:hypothetical protein